MQCAKCHSSETRVVRTRRRKGDGAIVRTYFCRSCGHMFAPVVRFRASVTGTQVEFAGRRRE